MVICMAVASRYVFLIGYCLYISKRLGDRQIVYHAKLYFCAIGINNIKPNAIIGIDELINCLVLIFPVSKYSVFNQSADIFITFVVSKARELADVADAIILDSDGVADEHIIFRAPEESIKFKTEKVYVLTIGG